MIDKKVLWEIRGIDLYTFLLGYDSNGWTRVNSFQIKGVVHDSCIVTRGNGWSWFSRGIFSRNPIDFLMQYYELDFNAALKVLRKYMAESDAVRTADVVPGHERLVASLPEMDEVGPWRAMYAYLSGERKISRKVIDEVVARKLVYQTGGRWHNICFVNEERNHWEVIGTGCVRYKRISDGQRYWSLHFSFNKCYVCESALDAISLYELLQDETASYVSVGGSKSRAAMINRIIRDFDEVVLAVDNDEAGDETARMFPSLGRMIPYNKDFNDDLVESRTSGRKYNYELKKAGVT